jgi:YtkA-like
MKFSKQFRYVYCNSRHQEDKKMKRITLLFIMLAIAILPLSGCMMWMHDDMSREHGARGTAQGQTFVKETRHDNIKIGAEVPPLWAGKEASLTLRIEDALSGEPISGAAVDIVVRRAERAEHAGTQHGAESAEKTVHGKAAEGAERGVYVFNQKFAEPGWYEITFSLTGLQEKGVATPVSLTVKKEVIPTHEPEGKDHGKTGGKSLLLIGGVMMVVMMLAIML